MARGVAIGAAGGILWGVIAAAVFAGMRAHLLPAPPELALPLALALVLAYLPFNVAIGVAVLLRLPAPSFVDLIGVTIMCGAVMGVVGSWLIAWARRRSHGAGRPR